MKYAVIILVIVCFFNCIAKAQQLDRVFTKTDTADLRMTACDFEKDAKAMILVDEANIISSFDSVVMVRHIKIKLFNNYDSSLTNIHLPFNSYDGFENIPLIEAQTIRIENNKIIVTKVDPKLIYTNNLDKNSKEIAFAFPDIKPGCIIEYKYTWTTLSVANLPIWFFQSGIPVRSSELNVTMGTWVQYTTMIKGSQAFAKKTSEVVLSSTGNHYIKYCWAKANVPSFVDEPYTPPGNYNLQYIDFRFHPLKYDFTGRVFMPHNLSWAKTIKNLRFDDDFGDQFDKNLADQDTILSKLKAFGTDEEKIVYLFNYVKRNIKWNEINHWYTDKGIRKAWKNKMGNSTEINLILCNLLNKAGVKANPMLVCTKYGGTIDTSYANLSQTNKTVVYIPVDSVKYYLLDASNKYSMYNVIPADIADTYGIEMTIPNKNDLFKNNAKAKPVFIKTGSAGLYLALTNGEILTDGRLNGTTVINNYGYDKMLYRRLYNDLDKDKYEDRLRGGDSRIKISELSIENEDDDTLPLTQTVKYNMELGNASDEYIYFNPNIFNPISDNPFTSEKRFADIDFENCKIYKMSGRYKIPAGYKIDVLPANVTLNFYDKTIVFKRVISQGDGFADVSYTITPTRSFFKADEYGAIHDFYKKMYEMLNEPIVLKKAL